MAVLVVYIVVDMAEKKDDTQAGEQASQFFMDYIEKAATTLFAADTGGMNFDCPSCGENLRDPSFAMKVLQGYTQCPGCNHDLKGFLTKAALILGSTLGKVHDFKCPYCGESSPIASYGGNVVDRFVICPNCRRDLFDPSAQY